MVPFDDRVDPRKRRLHAGCLRAVWVASVIAWLAVGFGDGQELKPLRYGDAQLTVNLAVGLWAWPMPIDFDHDGDLDLLVASPDKPYNGLYYFENPGGSKLPVFRAARRLGMGRQNVQLSWLASEPQVLTPSEVYPEFRETGLDNPVPLSLPRDFHRPVGTYSQKTRANQWRYVDYDGDGDHDVIVGIGDWSDYGWDDAYDAQGHWTHGPLHGFVYLIENKGNDAAPKYVDPVRVQAGDRDIDVFGWPTPNFADFDGDGDLDLICGEFLDGFTYFANSGSRTRPRYSSGQRLKSAGQPLAMDLQMIVPMACDWDQDGDIDLVVGDEDGRVALIENTAEIVEGVPQFLMPVYFQQEADRLKCGALATPCGFDWDGDGDEDILCGNTAGYIELFDNLGVSDQANPMPRFAPPRRLQANGQTIRIQAGPNGSIQGPCEAKWGYTTLSVADWDQDGLPDIMINSIWGRIQWYRNVGTRMRPLLAAAEDVLVAWDGPAPKPAWTWWNPTGRQLVTQWRTTPVMADWDADGLIDLVMLDTEGYLTWFPRSRAGEDLQLNPPRRVFLDESGQPLRLNERTAGGSGRRKLTIVDWDGDGQQDILVNGVNADWYRQTGMSEAGWQFASPQPLAATVLSSHTTSPTTVDWNKNGIPDLLIGAEDGHLYYMAR